VSTYEDKKWYRPDGGEAICLRRWPFRSFPVIRRHRRPRQVRSNSQPVTSCIRLVGSMAVSRFVFEIVTTSFFTTSETIIVAALSAVYTTSSTGFLLRSMVATVVKRTVLSWYRVRDRRTDNSFASFSLCWQLVYKGGDSCLLTQHVYAVAYTGRRKLRWECPTCDCGDYKHKKYTESKTSFFYCVRHRCTNASQSALFNVTIETIQPERNRKTPPHQPT